MLRVYKADFNQYSNLATKSIYNEKTQEYQSTDNGYLVIFDYDLSKYMEFGGGFRTLTYLGLMPNFGRKITMTSENMVIEKLL